MTPEKALAAIEALVSADEANMRPETRGIRARDLRAILDQVGTAGRVVARHATHGTGYVRVVPRHGGLSDVTTEAGSTYAVHDEQIRWLAEPSGGAA